MELSYVCVIIASLRNKLCLYRSVIAGKKFQLVPVKSSSILFLKADRAVDVLLRKIESSPGQGH